MSFSDDVGKKIGKVIGDALEKSFKEASKEVESKAERIEREKKARVKAFRTEASRLASMANKRLKRLEQAGLKDSPAYKKWIDEGGQKFGIKGKDYRQVQMEMARMRNFINSETSTVRGVNNVLKTMAKNTGIKYKNLKELRELSPKFFELASKVEQYLRTVEDMASAIGYQKIWEAINQYVQSEEINLADGEQNIEEMTHKVIQAMDVYREREEIHGDAPGVSMTVWYQLDDD